MVKDYSRGSKLLESRDNFSVVLDLTAAKDENVVDEVNSSCEFTQDLRHASLKIFLCRCSTEWKTQETKTSREHMNVVSSLHARERRIW